MDTPSIEALKLRAQELRQEFKTDGQIISHSKALELVARENGMKDWNTLSAKADSSRGKNIAPAFFIGQKVKGSYLGQTYSAIVHGLSLVGEVNSGYYNISLDLDNAVDVVSFEGFSNFRKHIRATIYETGNSAQRTSDGKPQLTVQPI